MISRSRENKSSCFYWYEVGAMRYIIIRLSEKWRATAGAAYSVVVVSSNEVQLTACEAAVSYLRFVRE